jgi:hypothetical protein
MGTRRAALHLDLFEQPGKREFFSILLERQLTERSPGSRIFNADAGLARRRGIFTLTKSRRPGIFTLCLLEE